MGIEENKLNKTSTCHTAEESRGLSSSVGSGLAVSFLHLSHHFLLSPDT